MSSGGISGRGYEFCSDFYFNIQKNSIFSRNAQGIHSFCSANVSCMLAHYGYLFYCYIVGLGLNCKFIDLLFKRSVIKFIKISSLVGFIVSEIIYSQTDTPTEELLDLR